MHGYLLAFQAFEVPKYIPSLLLYNYSILNYCYILSKYSVELNFLSSYFNIFYHHFYLLLSCDFIYNNNHILKLINVEIRRTLFLKSVFFIYISGKFLKTLKNNFLSLLSLKLMSISNRTVNQYI